MNKELQQLRSDFDSMVRTGPPLDVCSRILELMPHMAFTKDLANQVTWCNAATVAGLGFSREDLCTKNIADLVGPDEAEHFLANDMEVASSGQPKLGIYESMTYPDGSRRWYRTDKLPLFSADGEEVVGIVGFAVEITHLVLEGKIEAPC